MTDDLHRNFAGRRILVVEDEGLIALDIQDMLEGWDCTVLGPVATNAAALQLIRDERPDAGILDVHLNGETSEPIADALRSQGRPFLVLTAYQRNHLFGALVNAPVLNKPVDEKKLWQELSALLLDNGRA